MVDEPGIGMAGHPLTTDLNEQLTLAEAVKEFVQERVTEMIDASGRRGSADLLRCPTCGDRVILLDRPATYVVRHEGRICAACGAEQELVSMYATEADIGGEGGGEGGG